MNQPLSESAKKILQCCRQGQFDQLLNLLNTGLAIEEVNHADFLPLNVALRNGRWKIAKYLLQNNAVPINIDKPPLIAATQFKKDITTGIELVFAHTGDLEVTDKNNRTALMTACLLGHEKKVRYLLSGTQTWSATDHMGMNAFMDAVISQSNNIVELLLSKDIDVQHTNHNGDNALFLATQSKNPNMRLIKTLLNQNIDSCHKNKQDQSAFSVAEKKHPLIHKQFIAKLESEKQMELPLFTPATQNEPVAKDAQEPQDKSIKKTTPGIHDGQWFHAVTEGNLGKLNQLKVKGVTVDVLDSKGCTALIHAAGKGLRAVTSYLIQNKADIEHKSNNGSTPLSSAIISNSKSVVGLLLHHHANPNGTGPGGYPYISLAASQWNEACVSMLVSAGADINTTDSNGMTLFHHISIAAEYYANTSKAKDTIRLVKQHGLDINQTNNDGNTALHLLCGASKVKSYQVNDSHLANIAHELLKSGANPKLTNKKGFTALQYAKQHGLANTKGVILSFWELW